MGEFFGQEQGKRWRTRASLVGRWALGVVGALIVFMGSTSRQDATSNIASYFEWLPGVQALLSPHSADVWAKAIGVALVVGTLVWGFIRRWRTPPLESAKYEPREPDGPPTFDEEFERMRAREYGELKVERDKGLPEALAYALCGLWGLRFLDVVAEGVGEAGTIVQDFCQRAHDSKLTVWGKRWPHGIHVKIKPGFWEDHQPEWFDLLRGIARTEKTIATASSERFSDLMVSMTEFEREWPHGWAPQPGS